MTHTRLLLHVLDMFPLWHVTAEFPITERLSLLYPMRPPKVSVGWQPLDHGSHLLVCVYSETAVLGDAGQLHVLGVKLLLHDLFERLEHERLGVG